MRDCLATSFFYRFSCYLPARVRAALIYEVVWFQLLQLVIGSSAVSLGVLLGTYMGVDVPGQFAAPRKVISRRDHPLRVYGLLELGIGIFGVAVVLFVIPMLEWDLYGGGLGMGCCVDLCCAGWL